MIKFVNQIDSLNAVNKELKTENKEVRRKYNEASESVAQLSKDKENLHEVVTRAAKLDVTNFSMETLNSRNKKTTWFSQVATLKFNYSISKNITADPGRKTVYLRLTRPDNEVLTTNAANSFQFEDKKIAYSAKKDFDYAGETLTDVIYWKVDEIVQKGNYRADFFIDGNRVGSFTFELKK
jgi:chromosome segregation ATPase